jgi:hypothetical protein
MLYARQFIAGPRETTGHDLAGHERWAGDVVISHHRGLAVTRVASVDRELLCLGHAIDPTHPEADNAGVLSRVLEQGTTFAGFEEAIASLGGRWLLFFQLGDERRVYPDAAGTKSVFHARSAAGETWLASQPGLLSAALDLPIDPALGGRFASFPSAVAWPAELTPYPGVRQLLPNHYLDLRQARAVRFWPSSPLLHRELDEAAACMRDLLHGTVQAAMARGSVAIPLTGGYDSRTLLACAGDLRPQIHFFTVADRKTPRHDVWIPRKLASTMGLQFSSVPSHPCDAQPSRRCGPACEAWRVTRRNVADMWRDPADGQVCSFGVPPADFVLLGQVSEVCRCFYYGSGVHPSGVGPEWLAALAGYPGDSLARDAFASWLAGVPRDSPVNLLDLFYWEARLGNWASMSCTALDTVAEVFSPYNCRRLLEVGLGTDLAYRRKPYLLHRRICELAAPETSAVPFNHTWLDRPRDLLRRCVPLRVREAARTMRSRLRQLVR